MSPALPIMTRNTALENESTSSEYWISTDRTFAFVAVSNDSVRTYAETN